MICRWTSWKSQRTSKSPEKHNLLSIILEKMPWLLPLPKCYTKHQLSSHFPFHKQTWIFFSCCSLTEQVISKRPSELSVPIVTGHYLITPPWSDLMNSASQYTQLCQNGPGFEVWRFKGGPDLRGRSCWTEWHIAALHSQAANIWRGDGQL